MGLYRIDSSAAIVGVSKGHFRRLSKLARVTPVKISREGRAPVHFWTDANLSVIAKYRSEHDGSTHDRGPSQERKSKLKDIG